MFEIINRLNVLIKRVEESEFEFKDKIEYLCKFNLDCLNLSQEKTLDIFKTMYIFTNTYSYEEATNIFNKLEFYINRINCELEVELGILLEYFFKNEDTIDINDLKVSESDYKRQLKEFKSNKLPKDLKKIFKELFNKDNKIDFEAYNLFLELAKDPLSIHALDLSIVLVRINVLKEEFDFYKKNKLNRDYKELKAKLKVLQNVLDEFKNERNSMLERKRKFEKNKTKKINIIKKLKEDLEKEKQIDTSKLESIIDDIELFCNLIIYENEFYNDTYDTESKRNKYLKDNLINSKEKLLKQYKFNINPNKILISDEELSNILPKINDIIPKIKDYTNITICIINNIYYLDLDKILGLLLNNHITLEFILDNIDKLSNKSILDNFINNINLLLQFNINIKNIIKYDENILFYQNDSLNKLLTIYSKYFIDFSGDYTNFEFLKHDLSYIIDKFIEIKEYDLIKNNPSLINKESINIINRIIIYKNLGNKIVNEQNKLRGSLRKEENFILTDKEINEIVIPNYEELMDNDILSMLSNSIDNNDLSMSDKNSISNISNTLANFLISNIYYDFDGIIVSKNKIERNMKKLLSSNLVDNHSYNELLYCSILYNYPKLLTEENINKLKRIVFSNKILMK